MVTVPDAAFATTSAQLFDVHALGFPASPFTCDDRYVDLIRFPARATMRLEKAVGGTEQATRALTGGKSVGRATPFSRYIGTLAEFNGAHLTADVIDQGRRIVLATDTKPGDERFVRTGRGRWKYEIPFDQAQGIIELDMEAKWNGLNLRPGRSSPPGAAGTARARPAALESPHG
ncbi:hypothetical protein RCH12_000382 [Cryobacterium sp. MP_3.1]|uniref:hypothetical protein n=1 Tax=Cryobacterium sp. MP_3.1 TaxID=3071711 RepID=UPI002E0325B7|nr:hypothetical protein [Cryobacterium sp. MP_3.1]